MQLKRVLHPCRSFVPSVHRLRVGRAIILITVCLFARTFPVLLLYNRVELKGAGFSLQIFCFFIKHEVKNHESIFHRFLKQMPPQDRIIKRKTFKE